MKKVYLSIIFLFYCLTAFPCLITLIDPQTRERFEANVEEAILTVKPAGYYLEYNLNLTFGARKIPGGSENRQFEVVMDFEIPNGSFFTDAWLWIGDQIVKAQIVDVQQATAVYENIVKRKSDPLKLTRSPLGFYRLQVYPLLGSSTRKVKLTYLVPVTWGPGIITAPLSVDYLKSIMDHPTMKLKIYNSSNYKFIKMPELSGQQFKVSDNFTQQSYLETTINFNQTFVPINISFEVTTFDDIVFHYTPINRFEGYYQILFNPKKFMFDSITYKTLILLDFRYQPVNKQRKILNDALNTLLSTSSAKDQFNVAFLSNGMVQWAYYSWSKMNKNNIDKVVQNFRIREDSITSNLPILITDAMKIIKEKETNTQVILISDYDQKTNINELSNDLFSNLNDNNLLLSQLHIFDLNPPDMIIDTYLSYLAGISDGKYYQLNKYSSLAGEFLQFIKTINSSIQLLAKDISFNEFVNIEPSPGQKNISAQVVQLGKYYGELPFPDITVIYNRSSYTFKANPLEIFNLYPLKESFYGYQVKKIDNLSSPTLIPRIIDMSLKGNVLSTYTAFLALEPSDTIKVCSSCMQTEQNNNVQNAINQSDNNNVDNGQTAGNNNQNNYQGSTSTGNQKQKRFDELIAYPAIFSNYVTLKIKLENQGLTSDYQLKIFDNRGIPVKTFDLRCFNSQDEITITWNGEGDFGEIANGIYFIVLQCKKSYKVFKIIKMK